MALLKQKQIEDLVSDLASKLDLAGGTLTGDLVLNADPDANLKAATKQYVDNKVSSSVNYQGGYDADTNTPDLDTSPSGISIGDMYTVTVAGTFFTKALEIGDVLISEKDNPTLEADWTIVNKDLDAASIKVSYESNADTNAFTDADESKLDGIEALADVTDTANVTSAGALMDSEVDADIKTLVLPANTTITAFAQTFLDDATQGDVQTTLDVDPAGTDNSTNVTIIGEDYLTLSGQEITAVAIDLDNLSATGTPTGSNFLRGDNTWAVPEGAGDMVLADAQTVTGAKTFDTGTLLLNDTDSLFDLELASTSTITTANKTLTFDVNDSNRTLTISADATVSGTNTGDLQTLANGVSDVTATAAELNLLDLAGLTTGWVLSADSATTASWKAPTDLTEITEEDETCPVESASTNFDITLSTAPSGGVAGITSVHINGHGISAGELVSVVGTTVTLNVPYAVDATDVATVRYF